MATPATALRLRARFVHVHGTAIQLCAVQTIDSRRCLAAVGHLDESESARLPGVTIGYDADALDSAVLFEGGTKFVLGGLVT
jgi:hypothetical protein